MGLHSNTLSYNSLYTCITCVLHTYLCVRVNNFVLTNSLKSLPLCRDHVELFMLVHVLMGLLTVSH